MGVLPSAKLGTKDLRLPAKISVGHDQSTQGFDWAIAVGCCVVHDVTLVSNVTAEEAVNVASMWVRAQAYVPKSIVQHECTKTLIANLKQHKTDVANADELHAMHHATSDRDAKASALDA